MVVVWIVIAIPLSHVVHELGHALGARLMRFRVELVRIGTGARIARFSIGSTVFDVRGPRTGGWVRAVPIGPRALRARYTCFYVAGVGAVWLTAAVIVPFANADVAGALLIAALLQLFNVIPRMARMSFGRTPNDALLLCRMLFPSPTYLAPIVRRSLLEEYYQQWLRQDWHANLETASEFGRRFPDDNLGPILRSTARWQLGMTLDLDPRHVVPLWTPAPGRFIGQMLAPLTNRVVYEALVEHTRLEPALVDAMRTTHEFAPDEASLTDTLAWALIDSGAVDEGLELSEAIDETGFDDANRAAILAVRAIGYTKAGRVAEAAALRAELVSLDPECPLLGHLDAISPSPR